MAVRDLIYDAMYAAGVLGEGESSSSPESAQYALRKLQRMIDSWANDGLMVYTQTQETMTLSAGDATYTTADLSTNTRPVALERAFVRYSDTDTEVRIVTRQQWNAIAFKAGEGVPEVVKYEPAMTAGQFTFYPVPHETMAVYFDCRRVLGSGWTLDTEVTLPPGYEKALVDNLAVELCSGGFGVQASPALLQAARASKAVLARINWQPPLLRNQFEALPSDIYSGV